MSKFALEVFRDEEGNPVDFGKTAIRKLSINGVCPFDEYWNSLDEKLQDIFQTRFEQISGASHFPPKSKFKELKRDVKDDIKDYEFKEGLERVYFFKYKVDQTTYIVVLGEKKNNNKGQRKTINRFRKIKKEYVKSIKD